MNLPTIYESHYTVHTNMVYHISNLFGANPPGFLCELHIRTLFCLLSILFLVSFFTTIAPFSFYERFAIIQGLDL
jgi:hypothetical protein